MPHIWRTFRQRLSLQRRFRSDRYWEQRYSAGGTSGAGSYGRLAQWKADTLNRFVAEQGISRVVELGCGDGNQLTLAQYREYVGFDVARRAVELCREKFSGKPWEFHVITAEDFARIGQAFAPELVMSLDVIFHLTEARVFDEYMRRLFSLNPRFVIIYSSNGNFAVAATHIRNWKFSDWIDVNAPEWQLVRKIDNPYPFDPNDPDRTSFSDFYVYERLAQPAL